MFRIRGSRVVKQNMVVVEGEQNLGAQVDFEKQNWPESLKGMWQRDASHIALQKKAPTKSFYSR